MGKRQGSRIDERTDRRNRVETLSWEHAWHHHRNNEEARWSVSETSVEKKGNHEVKVISSRTVLWVIVRTLAFPLKEGIIREL